MVRERKQWSGIPGEEPNKFDATPIDLDDVILSEMKIEVAKASILKDYHRIRPMKFVQICRTVGIDELDLQDWIQEVLRRK